MKRISSAIVAAIAVGCLAAQTNAPVILKATTRLVMLSVIARDKNNQPATDLTKEDFRIRVNGKTQPISVFSMESSGPLPSAPGVPPTRSTRRRRSFATCTHSSPPTTSDSTRSVLR